MTANDVKILSGSYGVVELDVDDRNTSLIGQLRVGEPVKRGGSGGNYMVILETGDPEIGTDIFTGIVHKASTETATANGKVEVELVGPGTMLEAKATTAGNIDTAAKLLALMMDYVAFDVATATVFTVDEDEGDDPNAHGLVILGGDVVAGRLKVGVNINATMFGSIVGQTID